MAASRALRAQDPQPQLKTALRDGELFLGFFFSLSSPNAVGNESSNFSLHSGSPWSFEAETESTWLRVGDCVCLRSTHGHSDDNPVENNNNSEEFIGDCVTADLTPYRTLAP